MRGKKKNVEIALSTLSSFKAVSETKFQHTDMIDVKTIFFPPADHCFDDGHAVYYSFYPQQKPTNTLYRNLKTE